MSHVEDTAPEFYEDTACATLLAVDGTLYRPMNIPLAGAAEGTPYTPVSQSGVSGSGSAARSVTLWRAGDCYLQDSDGGFGSVDVETGAVACVAPDPDAPAAPGDRIRSLK